MCCSHPSNWHCCLSDSPNMTGFMTVVSFLDPSSGPFCSILNRKQLILCLSLWMYVAEWNQWTLKGDVRAFGAFTYDSMGKKLRFRSNESSPMNTSIGLDLLMFFDEVADVFLSLEINCSLVAGLFSHLDIWIRLQTPARGCSTRLTAKTRAVRRNPCNAACTLWIFQTTRHFMLLTTLGVPPSKERA